MTASCRTGPRMMGARWGVLRCGCVAVVLVLDGWNRVAPTRRTVMAMPQGAVAKRTWSAVGPGPRSGRSGSRVVRIWWERSWVQGWPWARGRRRRRRSAGRNGSDISLEGSVSVSMRRRWWVGHLSLWR